MVCVSRIYTPTFTMKLLCVAECEAHMLYLGVPRRVASIANGGVVKTKKNIF